ncbi:MAG: phenylalanine--tRNA ligase subunit alpha [Candidatus Aenigmarchaeota archaeon]|nr:phenylalanine--tRNA ligase subunit alpha [Candidatus Aenigmarchaeota archaeon]
MYQLTKEGKEYLEKGLPEKRLLNKLKTPKMMKDIKGEQIAIGWARKNKWIQIKDGKLEMTQEGRNVIGMKIRMEEALEEVNERGGTKEDMLKILLSRKLVEEAKEKKEFTEKEIKELTSDIIISEAWKKVPFKKYDVNAPAPEIHPGKKHFVRQTLDYIRRIWIEMGFKEMRGSLVEVAFWNFDALYQPQDHPARDLADTFYMKHPSTGKIPDKFKNKVKIMHETGGKLPSTGWRYNWDINKAKQLCLRTHTTCLSARTLANLSLKDLPAKYFSIGRVFRNETLDWKHLFEFYQVDGIVAGEDVNFRHLLGYLKKFFEKMGFPKARFRPAYFPYTEPSVEIEVYVPEKKNWMELGGAGMFRPEVVEPLLGKDVPVLAWGPGLDRMVMDAYKIKDIRKLYENDLKLLRKARLW